MSGSGSYANNIFPVCTVTISVDNTFIFTYLYNVYLSCIALLLEEEIRRKEMSFVNREDLNIRYCLTH